MSTHTNWHDQQAQYPPPPQQRHHPNMDPYAGPSPSSQQGPPYLNSSHVASYPQAHLPPPICRQPPQQQWTPSGSQDFSGPSPANSTARSSGPYASAFDQPPSSIGSTNSPMRQHGTHASPYASQSPYAPPPSHGSSDSHLHPGPRGSVPTQYDYSSTHGPSGYAHPHHPSSQSQNPQQQPPPPPQSMSAQHHSHSSQPHWNAAPLPSVLQPQSLPSAPGPGITRGPGGISSHPIDRPFGVPKQEDDLDDDEIGGYDDYDSKGKARAGESAQTPNKGTSDFVKKLFSMLDDKAYESVVAWSPSGESFIVKDMNDFTKHVLPRNFRHSNFASFVRQLNKYDFHKVKNPEDGSGTLGEHVWEFQHPDFVRGREDLLENVKRKIPAKKKPNLKGGLVDGDRDDSPSIPLQVVDAGDKVGEYADLKAQIASLTAVQDQMQNHILALTKQYQGVIGEMLTFQRNMVQQDQLMQNLIQYLMNLEQERPINNAPSQSNATSFLPHSGNSTNANEDSFLAHGVANSYESANAGSFPHMNDISRRANDSIGLNAATGPHSVGSSDPSAEASSSTNAASSTRMSGMTSAPSTTAPLSPKSVASPMDDNNGKTPEMSQQLGNPLAPMVLHPPRLGGDEAEPLINAAASAVRNPSLSSFEKAGLRVFTVESLQPRENGAPDQASSSNGSVAPEYRSKDQSLAMPQLDQSPLTMPKLDSRTTSFDSTKRAKESTSTDPKKSLTPTGEAGKYLRVRRSTLVPGWAVPPRVLLVDDDEVCRRLSSKFLQVFGCSIDYAVDGMSAVNKMNLEKYDLVLMDIVMPNLDGISATSLIRQFDPKTPIISMTSNSGPSELINYMSSGMTDILPKPFTKEGLLNMLEKHLLHLKAVQREHRQSGDMNNVIKSGVAPSPNPVGAGGSTPSSNGGMAGGEGEGSLNPLAGMGFTDEEYVAMLQNLIAAGTDDDVGGMMGEGSASKDGPPVREANPRSPFGNPAFKRPNHVDDALSKFPMHSEAPNKRSRFGEIS